MPLQQKGVPYSSRYAASEILASMAETVDAEVKRKLFYRSLFITMLADGSTDISNDQCLKIYPQTVDPESFEPGK